MGEMAEDAYIEALLEEYDLENGNWLEKFLLLGREHFESNPRYAQTEDLSDFQEIQAVKQAEKQFRGGKQVGDMAQYYSDGEFMAGMKRRRTNQAVQYQQGVMYTEEILNRTSWVTGQGEIIEVEHMGKDHIRNTLNFLYKRKDKYWLNCRDGKLIEQFENGEDFFQRVIRRSTLWNELIRVLTEDGATGFNFEIGGREV